MDDALVTFFLLLFVFLWRCLTFGDGAIARGLQKCIHAFGPLGGILQWYGLLFVSLGAFLVRTFYDVYRFEYVKYNFLHRSDVESIENFIPGLTADEREAMEVTPWIRVLSLAAPCAGVFAAILAGEHVYSIAKNNRKIQKQKGETFCWKVPRELNMVFFVIAMPMVFIIMAMRAEIRAWAVMTGSAWLPYHSGPQPPARSWTEVKELELATYTTDLEIAGFFQYMTILFFGRLCVSYLRAAPDEYKFALKTAGLQGVALYVIFGLIRSAATFAEAVASQHPWLQLEAAILREKVLTAIAPIFTVATLLCVFNMFIICSMEDVRKHLGNAQMKFNATRALVLVSQIQQGVLLGFVVGSPLKEKLTQPPVPAFLQGVPVDWRFSAERAKLMHAALLNFECLLVVILNRWAWGTKADYSGDDEDLPYTVDDYDLDKPLLNS